MKKIFLFLVIFTASLSLIGCLTVETKEYSFKLKKGNSGEGKIKYINIRRTMDSTSSIEADYDELINSYLKGSMPENEMSGVKYVKKRLFEEDNQLCGEITFEFDNIETLKFYNYKNKVWAYNLGGSVSLFGSNETFFSSNGTYGEANMPVIFWDDNEKTFEFKTVTPPGEVSMESLLGMWRKKEGK